MKISFLAIGRLKGAEQELCDRYVGRIPSIGRQLGVLECTLTVLNEARGHRAEARKESEGGALLGKMADKAYVIALDERGKTLDSQGFARMIATLRDEGTRELVFVLGGPDGHGAGLLQKADRKLSLSALTLPHGLARAVLAEQVYRALTILANHPYHRQ